jgi:hypothetical protein
MGGDDSPGSEKFSKHRVEGGDGAARRFKLK